VAWTVNFVLDNTVTFTPALDDSSSSGMLIENWAAGTIDLDEDFHLYPSSQCIDAGNNLDSGNLGHDLDGKPRFIDSDGDMIATVDMGTYEYDDICECDTSMDLDTDGLDMANYISNPGSNL
jgi:hypothetical protein